MPLIIRGGTVVTETAQFVADVRVEGERITAVGRDIHLPGDRVLDASGCFVMPGGIDPHTHIEMPAGDLGRTADDWHSGTAAAVEGGTTCVLDMITPEPGGALAAALYDWRRRAAQGALCDYSFHMGVTEARPDIIEEMAAIVAAGVSSFKLYLAYKGRLMVDDGAAFRIMREAGRLGAWTLVHAENGDLIEALTADAVRAGRLDAGAHGATRPPVAEGEATHRAIQLARAAEAPVYIVHVTCREALAPIRRARQNGLPVIGEACAHHLVLTDENQGLPYVLSPPLRPQADRQALWDAYADGTLSVTATDHCPWNLQGQKERGRDDFTRIPNGAPGIEERMALLWTHGVTTGRWSPSQFVTHTSAEAARIFGLSTKGAVHPGYDADLVIWDPSNRRTLSAATQRSSVDHCLYEGMEVTGQPRYVLVRGAEAKAGAGRQAARINRR